MIADNPNCVVLGSLGLTNTEDVPIAAPPTNARLKERSGLDRVSPCKLA